MKYEVFLKVFAAVFGLFAFACAGSHSADLAQVSQVLKGDTMIVVFFNTKAVDGREMKYIHLVGVDAPELNQAYGQEARSSLASMVLNQKVQIIRIKEIGNHVLARVYAGQRDPGAELVRNGLAVPKFDEVSGLGSVQKAAYETLAERARFKKIGLWKDGDLFFAQSPSAFRKLELDRVDQQRINGAADPKFEGFERPGPPTRQKTDLHRFGK
jgi:endonuclease YncB( thermonuclease family)